MSFEPAPGGRVTPWLAMLSIASVAACGQASAGGGVQAPMPSPKDDSAELAARAKQELGVLPEAPALDAKLVSLGRALFFETRFSADAKVGCVTCHQPSLWGTDGLARSKGAFGRDNPRNAPTVFNAALQYAAHWRADRESVEDQARRALLGRPSFGLESNEQAVKLMSELPGYADAFRAAFPNDEAPVSVQNWGTAIGAYERTLLTPAPFDAFVSGNTGVLSVAQRAGLKVFLDVGCATCHGGPLLGGAFAKRFGEAAAYAPLTHSDPIDAGRFDVTHDEKDRFVFKVPSLRNVEKTGPYFHDGSVPQLRDAVDIMGKTQLGKTLSAEQLDGLVAFLGALTAEVPASFAPPPAAATSK